MPEDRQHNISHRGAGWVCIGGGCWVASGGGPCITAGHELAMCQGFILQAQ